MRNTLSSEKLNNGAQSRMERFFPEVVREIESALATDEWVVVGMAQNLFVKKARARLKTAGADFKYIEQGSYFGGWQKRLAIKLWSGWPTFPQVFHNGVLIGGASELEAYLAKTRT